MTCLRCGRGHGGQFRPQVDPGCNSGVGAPSSFPAFGRRLQESSATEPQCQPVQLLRPGDRFCRPRVQGRSEGGRPGGGVLSRASLSFGRHTSHLCGAGSEWGQAFPQIGPPESGVELEGTAGRSVLQMGNKATQTPAHLQSREVVPRPECASRSSDSKPSSRPQGSHGSGLQSTWELGRKTEV